MRKRTAALAVLVLLSFPALVNAQSIKGRLGLGLNYPGVSARYGLSNKFALELKGQFGSGVTVFGPRAYYYFSTDSKVCLFAGAELDYVSFKGDVSSGGGRAVEPFVGGDYFISEHLALGLDIGPAFIAISDKDTDESVSGMEFVANINITWYLW